MTTDGAVQEFAPDITRDEMFWRAIRRAPNGADSNMERFVLAVASAWIRPGDFVVDLGANHGQHARVFGSCLADRGKLLLVEADPSLVSGLERGAAASRVEIQVVNAAVGDESLTHVTFYRHPRLDQNGSMFRREDAADYEELRVPATTLDVLTAGMPAPRFVKIDVEGAEFSVLRGARQLLTRHAPLIAVEISFDSEIESPKSVNYELTDLLDLLDSLGWSAFLLDGSRLTMRALEDPSFRLHYQCWLARNDSASETFVTTAVKQLASAFAWGATTTPPYPFHLAAHPVV